jgi:hypothetical protein
VTQSPAPDRALTPEEVASALDRAGPRIAARLRANLLAYLQGFAMRVPPLLMRRAGPAGLRSRSGTLANSFQAAELPGASDEEWAGSVYTRAPYARLQEFGGTVTPKRAKYLTIPLDAAKTRAAGQVRGYARSWPGITFVRRLDDGRLCVFVRKGQGKRAREIPIFLLVRSVTVPPRLGFREAWDADAPARDRVLDRSVREGLTDAE